MMSSNLKDILLATIFLKVMGAKELQFGQFEILNWRSKPFRIDLRQTI